MSAHRTKRSLESQNSVENQSEAPSGNEFHVADNTSSSHGSQSETQHLTSASRRKLGSRRRNRQQQHEKDSATELHHKPREELEESTKGSEALGITQLITKPEGQEELYDQGSERDLSVTQDSSLHPSTTSGYSCEAQGPLMKNLEDIPEILRSRDPISSYSYGSLETILEKTAASAILPSEGVKENTASGSDSLISLRREEESDLSWQDENVVEGNSLKGELRVDSVDTGLSATPEVTTDKNSPRQHTPLADDNENEHVALHLVSRRKLGSSRRNKRQQPVKDVTEPEEEPVGGFDAFETAMFPPQTEESVEMTLEGVDRSDTDRTEGEEVARGAQSLNEEEAKPAEMQDTRVTDPSFERANAEICFSNLTDQAEVGESSQADCVKWVADSAPEQEVSKPDLEQDEHPEKQNGAAEFKLNKSADQVDENPENSDTDRLDTKEEPSEEDIKPSEEQTSHQEKEGLPTDVTENRTPLETVEPETHAPFDSQPQDTSVIVDKTNTEVKSPSQTEDICDDSKESAHSSSSTITNVHSSLSVEVQVTEQPNSPAGFYSAETESKNEDTELLTRWGILQPLNSGDGTHVNSDSVESSSKTEKTTDTSEHREHTEAKNGAEEAAGSSPEEDGEGRRSEDAVEEVNKEEAELIHMQKTLHIAAEAESHLESEPVDNPVSISEETPSGFKLTGNRKKLGSSRRLKGRRRGPEITGPEEEDVDRTWSDELSGKENQPIPTGTGSQEELTEPTSPDLKLQSAEEQQEHTEQIPEEGVGLLQSLMDNRTTVTTDTLESTEGGNEAGKKFPSEPEDFSPLPVYEAVTVEAIQSVEASVWNSDAHNISNREGDDSTESVPSDGLDQEGTPQIPQTESLPCDEDSVEQESCVQQTGTESEGDVVGKEAESLIGDQGPGEVDVEDEHKDPANEDHSAPETNTLIQVTHGARFSVAQNKTETLEMGHEENTRAKPDEDSEVSTSADRPNSRGQKNDDEDTVNSDSGVIEATQNERQSPEGIQVGPLQDQPLKPVEEPSVLVVDHEMEESVIQEPNNAPGGAHKTNIETKDSTPNVSSPNRRRKMGSTRRNLGSRPKEENSHQKQTHENSDSVAASSKPEITTTDTSEHREHTEAQSGAEEAAGSSPEEDGEGRHSEDAVEEVNKEEAELIHMQKTLHIAAEAESHLESEPVDNPVSISEETPSGFKLTGNRRKLGSSRRLKGRRRGPEITGPEEEDVDRTWSDELSGKENQPIPTGTGSQEELTEPTRADLKLQSAEEQQEHTEQIPEEGVGLLQSLMDNRTTVTTDTLESTEGGNEAGKKFLSEPEDFSPLPVYEAVTVEAIQSVEASVWDSDAHNISNHEENTGAGPHEDSGTSRKRNTDEDVISTDSGIKEATHNQTQGLIQDQPLKPVEEPSVLVVDEEMEESVLHEPNNAPGGTHKTNFEIKDSTPHVSSPNRRRKMGSTRRNLGSRPKEENSHQKQTFNAGGFSQTIVDVHRNSDSEQREENAFETVELKSPVQQTVEKHPDPLRPAETEHHLTPDYLPERRSPPHQDDAPSEAAAGGRRRKMGSHRRSRGQSGDGRTGAQTEREEEDREESLGLNERAEVEESVKESSSDISVPAEHSSGTAPERETPVQQHGAEIHPRPGGQNTFSLAGGSRGADVTSKSFNVLLVGDSSVGKTSLMKRAHSGKFSHDVPATVGLDYCMWTVLVDGKPVVLQLWDTAGQERFHSLTRQAFHKAQAFLLMYDITSSQSFSAVSYWANCIQEGAAEDVTILLLGNKSDCQERSVPTVEGKILAEEYNFEFMECSAATGDNVIHSLETVARMLSERIDTREEAMALHKNPPVKKRSGCC